jgi:tetratricopeptide (TPR) repeat protein
LPLAKTDAYNGLMHIAIDPNEFLSVVRPALKQQDVKGLAHGVRTRWRNDQVRGLLTHGDVDVRRTAALVMSLIGDMSDAPTLTCALQDNDEQVNQLAEDALWSIWFRACKGGAYKPFHEGLDHIARESYAQAIACFAKAQTLDRTFAESYNQCAIAHYFGGDWDASLDQCRRAVKLIPTHFGAILGMGHCFAQLGQLSKATTCYRHALWINPRMPAIARTLDRVREQMRGVDDAKVLPEFNQMMA